VFHILFVGLRCLWLCIEERFIYYITITSIHFQTFGEPYWSRNTNNNRWYYELKIISQSISIVL